MNSLDDRYVITRTGCVEPFDIEQISHRIDQLINKSPRLDKVRRNDLLMQVCQQLPAHQLKTTDIDDECARCASSMSVRCPQFLDLAARILIDNHQKNTSRSFTDKMRQAYSRKDATGKIFPLINKRFYKYVTEHQDQIESLLDYQRDFYLTYFGMKTFLDIYGIRIGGHVIERPQDMFMRVAIALYADHEVNQQKERRVYGLISDDDWYAEYTKAVAADILAIKQCYDTLSTLQYSHATPTYFNAGSCAQQLSSCFLLGVGDSLEGIKAASTDITAISKMGGGIGLHVHRIRGAESLIRGTNGKSSGAIPFLKIYNEDMRAFNQGGRRMGSAAAYMAMHHPDIEAFISLKVPGGPEEQRARDLFPACWISDLFMERVKEDGQWSLFDTDDQRVGPLHELYGQAFRDRYTALEQQGLAKKTIKARHLMEQMFEANKRTGVPYILFSDAVNAHNMQNNIGCVESSNLCTEITLYSDENETAVCNLTSTNLSAFVDRNDAGAPYFNFERLIKAVAQQVRNLNRVIDRNRYPTVRTHRSNMKHRPLGIGIQGWADVLCMMRIPFDSPEANDLNARCAETMYYAASSESSIEAKRVYKHRNQIFKSCGVYCHMVIDHDEQRTDLTNKLGMNSLNYAIAVYYNPHKFADQTAVQTAAASHIERLIQQMIDEQAEQMNQRDFSVAFHDALHIDDQPLAQQPLAQQPLAQQTSAPRGTQKIPAAYRRNKSLCSESATVYVTRILRANPPTVYYQATESLPKMIGSYQSINYINNRPATCYTENELKELQEFVTYQSGGKQTYLTSHTSNGIFHWELYDAKPVMGYDWESLREHRRTFGQANSTLLALMPTASTAQLLGNNEGAEPYSSNIYKRQTLAGEFIVFNKHFVKDCYDLHLWTAHLKDNLLLSGGSIAHIHEIPEEIRAIYRTTRDIDQECVVQQAAARQPYIDQAQSLNLHWTPEQITLKNFNRLIFSAWRAGLKTGKYYFRSLPAVMPQPFTIEPDIQRSIIAELEQRRAAYDMAGAIANKTPDCLVCGS